MPEVPALVLLAYASLLILSILDNLRGPYFPEMINDLHWNGTQGAMFFAIANLASAAVGWVSPRILHARSPLFLLAIASLCLSAGFAGIALSHEFMAVMLSTAVFGGMFGALNLAQNMLVVEGSPAHLRRRWLNGLHAMYGVASILAPLLATGYFLLGWNWRLAFLVTAALPIVTFIAVQFNSSKQAPAVPESKPTPLSPFEWKLILACAVVMSLYQFGEVSASSRMVLWLRTERGFTPESANFYLSAFFACMLTGRLGFGVIHFKGLSNWAVLVVSACTSALCYEFALMYSPLWMVVSGLTMAPFYPTALDEISQLFGRKSAQALGYSLGLVSLASVGMHMVIGWGTDRFGLTKALMIGPLSFALLFAGLGVIWTKGLHSRAAV